MPAILRVAALLALCASLTGCTTISLEAQILALSEPRYETMGTVATSPDAIEGYVERFWILFIPLGAKPRPKEAIEDCLKLGRGDFIRNAKIKRTGWTIGLVSYGAVTCSGNVGNSRVRN